MFDYACFTTSTMSCFLKVHIEDLQQSFQKFTVQDSVSNKFRETP